MKKLTFKRRDILKFGTFSSLSFVFSGKIIAKEAATEGEIFSNSFEENDSIEEALNSYDDQIPFPRFILKACASRINANESETYLDGPIIRPRQLDFYTPTPFVFPRMMGSKPYNEGNQAFVVKTYQGFIGFLLPSRTSFKETVSVGSDGRIQVLDNKNKVLVRYNFDELNRINVKRSLLRSKLIATGLIV